MKKLALLVILLFSANALADGQGDWPDTSNGIGHVIQDEGSTLNQRTNLNMTGAGITCTDSGGKTVCDVPGPTSATVLDQTAGEVDLIYDATNNRYCLSTDNDTTCDNTEQIVAPRHVLNAEEFLNGGTDYGVAINAAYEYLRSTLSPAGLGGVIEIPRGQLNIDTPIDMCDETGNYDHQNGVLVVGRGTNHPTQAGAGTQLFATATLATVRSATGTTTLSLTEDGGINGTDSITRAAGSFITDGFQRGDLIKIDGFNSTFDTDGGGSAIDPKKVYVVYAVEATELSVELVWNNNPAFVAVAGNGDESVTEMTRMARACAPNIRFSGINFRAENLVDTALEFYSDNSPTLACTGAGTPIAECTGAGTASGLQAVTTLGAGADNSAFNNANFANLLVRAASNAQGQADRMVFTNVTLHGSIFGTTTNTPVNLLVDNLQAKPAVKIVDSDLNSAGFANIWVSNGGVSVYGGNMTLGETSGDNCQLDTYGACYLVRIGPFNTTAQLFDGIAADIYEGGGIMNEATGGSDTDEMSMAIRNSTINYVGLTHSEDALNWNNEGGLYIDESTSFCRQSGATTTPLISIGNTDEATRPLNLYFGARHNTCSGGDMTTTLNNSVVNRALLDSGNGTLTGINTYTASITGAWDFTAGTATTPAANDNDTSLATTAYVQTEISNYASDSVAFTNKTITGGGAHDLGGATSFEIPNAADPTTDTVGEIAVDTDRYAASRGAIEFYDGTGSVYVVSTTDAPADGQVPKFVSATGTIEWSADADSGAGGGTLDLLTNVDTAGKANGDIIVWNSTSGKWEDSTPSSGAQAWTVADPVLLSTTTSDVVVGTGQVNSGKFTIDGDADQVQLTVQGNATQTDSVVIVENSGGTEVINLDVSGAGLFQSLSDIDGPGTLWSIDSSGNATFVSVTTAASASPTSTFNDSDSASEATDATITAAATDTGAGTEDVDMGFNVQVNSTLTSRLFIDADGLVEVRAGGLSVDASDPSDSGAIRLDNAEGIGWEASPTGTDVTLLADASEIIQIANGFLDGDDILADDIDEGQLAATITFANGDLVDFGTNISSATEGLLIPANATSCATATAEAQICWDEDSDVLSVGTGASTVSFSAGGDNVTVDGGAVTDPDFNDGGDIGFTNTANVITADIDADTILVADVADGDWGDFTIATNVASLDANAVASSEIDTIVQSMFWGAGAMSTDGVQCATPAEVTINSGPKLYSVICTDNDASTMWGSTVMPDGWDGGTVTFELSYVQTAVDTSAMNADVAAACRGSGETINSTLGTEQALDDAAVSGSNIVDHVTSAAVTADGTCAAGDTLWWRVQLDATGTTTAVATLNFLGVKMEFTSNVGD